MFRNSSNSVLADFPAPLMRGSAMKTFDRMLVRLEARLAELQWQLVPGQLAVDARRLDLFRDDNVDT